MTDIDSNIDANDGAHTRMDQDHQKNVKTPKASGTHAAPDTRAVVPNADIDEPNRDEAERLRVEREQQRGQARDPGEQGINVSGAEGLERDKRNP